MSAPKIDGYVGNYRNLDYGYSTPVIKSKDVDQKPEVVEVGYHTREIAKGVLGEVSKIREELEELEDALKQGNHIMALVEASDLYGALKAFAEAKGVTMEHLAVMADATKRSFTVGERVTRD